MLNRITLMGRLTHDPQLKQIGAESIAVASFSLAVQRDYKNKDSEKITDFFDIVAWRKKAEFVCKYFRKGQMMYVEGRLQRDRWEDNEGNKRITYKIILENCHFADSKKSQGSEQNNQSNDLFQPNNEEPDLPF